MANPESPEPPLKEAVAPVTKLEGFHQIVLGYLVPVKMRVGGYCP
jgi:hypothetical protein